MGTSILDKDVIKSNGSTKGEAEGDCVYAIANEAYVISYVSHYDVDITVCCFHSSCSLVDMAKN